VADWLGLETGRYSTAPEVARLGTTPVLCLRGEEEVDSACRLLHGSAVRSLVLPGGHHFGGSYERIADALLTGLATLTTSPTAR
jgi:type IV secretory pathway VirJ component